MGHKILQSPGGSRSRGFLFCRCLEGSRLSAAQKRRLKPIFLGFSTVPVVSGEISVCRNPARSNSSGIQPRLFRGSTRFLRNKFDRSLSRFFPQAPGDRRQLFQSRCYCQWRVAACHRSRRRTRMNPLLEQRNARSSELKSCPCRFQRKHRASHSQVHHPNQNRFTA
jgi:hypothetical protein